MAECRLLNVYSTKYSFKVATLTRLLSNDSLVLDKLTNILTYMPYFLIKIKNTFFKIKIS